MALLLSAEKNFIDAYETYIDWLFLKDLNKLKHNPELLSQMNFYINDYRNLAMSFIIDAKDVHNKLMINNVFPNNNSQQQINFACKDTCLKILTQCSKWNSANRLDTGESCLHTCDEKTHPLWVNIMKNNICDISEYETPHNKPPTPHK